MFPAIVYIYTRLRQGLPSHVHVTQRRSRVCDLVQPCTGQSDTFIALIMLAQVEGNDPTRLCTPTWGGGKDNAFLQKGGHL